MTNNFKRKIFISSLVATLIIGGAVFFTSSVLAQSVADPNSELQQGVDIIAKTGLPNTDIRVIAANIIRVALGLLGVIVLCLALYGGYTWMTAGGNEEKISEAKKILRNALVGLIIILSAYAIVSFVISKLIGATTHTYPAHCSDNEWQQDTEEKKDCGNECPPCDGGCPDGKCCQAIYCDNNLYVMSLPPTGNVCIRNYHPSIIFNRPVDLTTISGKIRIFKTSDTINKAMIDGTWAYAKDKNNNDVKNNIVFNPNGVCPGGGDEDCLDATTTYTFEIVSPSQIISLTDNLPLSCNLRVGCGPVVFTTGESVDRLPPSIEIIEPSVSDSQRAVGQPLWVTVSSSDDNGVQNISVNVGDNFIGSQSFANCQKSVNYQVSWNTQDFEPGNYTITASVFDFSARNDSAERNVLLRPTHCYNGFLDASSSPYNLLPEQYEIATGTPPAPDCGGTHCGRCAGDKCVSDIDCASGYCDQSTHTCVDKMRISHVSPLSGTTTVFVSVSGMYFGDNPGKISFSGPNKTWIQAALAPCGKDDTWKTSQIIATVPVGAVTGPIKVESSYRGKDGVTRDFIDTTDDDWGPKLNDFTVNNLLRPGLCSINPPNGAIGTNAMVSGTKFGVQTNSTTDQVAFGDLNDRSDSRDYRSVINSWSDNKVSVVVPTVNPGWTGAALYNDGIRSNVIGYQVDSNLAPDAPIISSITPNSGAKGEYITISGRNFGNTKGTVWLKEINAINPPSLSGAFNFPPECGKTTWSDDQIIIKFPDSPDAVFEKPYYIQVVVGAKESPKDPNINFTWNKDKPGPGICLIDPGAGPAPLSATGTLRIVGEYFAPSTGDKKTYANAYFWKSSASSTSIVNRTGSDRNKPTFDLSLDGEASEMHVAVPSTTMTGPVVVNRDADLTSVISNPVKYVKWDCLKNNKQCPDEDLKCCTVGNDAGMCRLKTDLCEAEVRNAGYTWMFCTKDIPVPPRVVEKCDSVTDAGKAIPSPSPSTQWVRPGYAREHERACLTSFVSVEISAPGGIVNGSAAFATLTPSQIIVRECNSSTINIAQRTCSQIGTNLPLRDKENHSTYYKLGNASNGSKNVQLAPSSTAYNGGKWMPNTWYQVVLFKSITGGPSSTPLAADFSCDLNGISNSAYCFLFKSGDVGADCKMKAVIITPYEYWTNFLEIPLMHHTAGGDRYNLYYSGNGLSDQYCIMMDASGYNWTWSATSTEYTNIFSGTTTQNFAQVSSLQNTVGVGLAGDAVNIHAIASTNTPAGPVSYGQDSPLTIDTSNPQVVEFWPNCLETCLDADIGARFNTTMSSKNLQYGGQSLKLQKCLDENCYTVTDAFVLSSFGTSRSGDIVVNYVDKGTLSPRGDSISFSLSSGYTLEPNTIYKVTLSANSTASSNLSLLWSRRALNDPDSYNKPMSQEFSWRFKTKKEACKVDHVQIDPASYIAQVNEKTTYQVQPYSASDKCSAAGQRINPWSVSWQWGSSSTSVATVHSFSTNGTNPYCTSRCIRKGSAIPTDSGLAASPVCGNGTVEAGEDCDIAVSGELPKSCTLNCLRPGNVSSTTCGDGIVSSTLGEECDPGVTNMSTSTREGCSNVCLHVGSKPSTAAEQTGASICGNGQIGVGEDCDLGIDANVNVNNSALSCSDRCLHLGSKISAKWCFDNRNTRGGYDSASFDKVCKTAVSQCGDKVQSPDEDPECDLITIGWVSSTCNIYCLKSDSSVPDSGCVWTDSAHTIPSYGCDTNLQHIGSSLGYTTPSVCGDGLVRTGEDDFCEQNLISLNRAGMVDPWSLVTALGLSKYVTTDDPPVQLAHIGATTTQKTLNNVPVGGRGELKIPCGYYTDDQCVAAAGPGYGVAANSCCYLRPQITKRYPAINAEDVCLNSSIYADFDKFLNPTLVQNNFVLAKGMATPTLGNYTDLTYSRPTVVNVYNTFAANPTDFATNYDTFAVVYKNESVLEIMALKNNSRFDLERIAVVKGDAGGQATFKKPIKVILEGNYVYVVAQENPGIEVMSVDIASRKVEHRNFVNTVSINGVSDKFIEISSASYFTNHLYVLGRVSKNPNHQIVAVCSVAGSDSVGCSNLIDSTNIIDNASRIVASNNGSPGHIYALFTASSSAYRFATANAGNDSTKINVGTGLTIKNILIGYSNNNIDNFISINSSNQPVMSSFKVDSAAFTGTPLVFASSSGVSFLAPAFTNYAFNGLVKNTFVLGSDKNGKIVYYNSSDQLSTTISLPTNSTVAGLARADEYSHILSSDGKIFTIFHGEFKRQIASDYNKYIFATDNNGNDFYTFTRSPSGQDGYLKLWSGGASITMTYFGETPILATQGDFVYDAYSRSRVVGWFLRIYNLHKSLLQERVLYDNQITSTAPNTAIDMKVVGDNLYVLDDKYLHIINILNPKQPELVSKISIVSTTLSTVPGFLEVKDNYAYILASLSSSSPIVALSIIDVYNSASPTLVSELVVSQTADLASLSSMLMHKSRPFGISNNLAYITTADGKLTTIDLSNPLVPTIANVTTIQNNSQFSLLVDGKYIYLRGTQSFDALKIWDVSSTTNPTAVRNVTLTGSTWGEWMLFKNKLYFGGSSGIKILDISKFASQADCTGENDVTALVKSLSYANNENLPWYKKLWLAVADFFRKVFVGSAIAEQWPEPRQWCVDTSLGTAGLVPGNTANNSRIVYYLNTPLDNNTKYAVIMNENLQDTDGVSLGHAQVIPVNWKFDTGEKLCTVDNVNIAPNSVFFQTLNTSTLLRATAKTDSGQEIQSITSTYAWQYLWGPKKNDFVNLSITTSPANIITPRNRNGEINVAATANVTENKLYPTQVGLAATGMSRVIVFLCNNPWPANLSTGAALLPYEDKIYNNDGFNLDSNFFTGAIPASVNGGVVINSSSDRGYYNFSTYYCMDNGGAEKIDDFPFMRPAVQAEYQALKSNVGVCDLSGDGCMLPTGNCDYRYATTTREFFGPLSTNYCFLNNKNNNKELYFANAEPLVCTSSSTCLADKNFAAQWKTASSSGNYTGYSCLAPASVGFIITSQSCVPRQQAFKRFLFTNQKNSDAIGVQIFPNPQVLTVEQWFNNDKTLGGQGFSGNMQNLTIDGYKAVRDDSNVYVDVLNVNTPDTSNPKTDTNRQFFSNIFLFSINKDAQPETKQVFDQLLTNLKFNINLTNYGYCGIDVFTPGADEIPCQSDFDCPGGQVCANQKIKLQRDYIRLRDLRDFGLGLSRYFSTNGYYPALKEGSYLSGQTLSTWPAWTTLGNSLGFSIAIDPINQLPKAGTCLVASSTTCTGDDPINGDKVCASGDKCILHDSVTGWSTEGRRFSYVCATGSLAYRYLYATSTAYTVRAHLEEPFSAKLFSIGSGWTIFKNNYFGTLRNNFDIDSADGICAGGLIASASSGVCGDGKVNIGKGEQCDPPGIKFYNVENCATTPSGTVKVCGSDCKWGPTTIIACDQSGIKIRNCGNGIVEVGETCDDGSKFNGRYNHCRSDCEGYVSARCGDGSVSSTVEVCDINTSTRSSGMGTGKGICVKGENVGQYCDNDTNCVLPGSKQVCSLQPEKLCSQNSDCLARFTFTFPPKGPTFAAPGTRFCAAIDYTDLTKSQFFKDQSSITPTACSSSSNNCSQKPDFMSWYAGWAVAKTNLGHTVGYACGDPSNGFWQQANQTCITTTTNPQTILGACVKPENVGGERYGIKKQDSCAFDCQSWGPYCGDGAIQSEYGEICDGDKKVTNNGQLGTMECRNNCRTEVFVPDNPPAEVTTPSQCGNSKVEDKEGCDMGDKNGIPCIPPYGHNSCYYCSADCRTPIEVQPTKFCGDKKVQTENGEMCDMVPLCNSKCQPMDANTTCDPNRNICWERHCGNNIVESQYGEECDDWGNINGDGCSVNCKIEEDYSCRTIARGPNAGGSTCKDDEKKFCGNGFVEVGEQCDRSSGDSEIACNNQCKYNPGYVCNNAGCTYSGYCGDGIKQETSIDGPEECDYTNGFWCIISCNQSGDEKCKFNTALQTTEIPGFPGIFSLTWKDIKGYVELTPSTCNPKGFCSDGELQYNEQCDLGSDNGVNGKNCRTDCTKIR